MVNLKQILDKNISVSRDELETTYIIHGRTLSDVIELLDILKPNVTNISEKDNPLGIYIPPRPLHLVPPLSHIAQPLGMDIYVSFYDVNGIPVYYVTEPTIDDLVLKIYVFLRQRVGELGVTKPSEVISVASDSFTDIGVDSKLALQDDSVKSAIYYVFRDMLGFGPIEPAMEDDFVEEVSWFSYDGPVEVVDKVVTDKYPNAEFIPTNIFFDLMLPDMQKKMFMMQVIRAVTSKANVGLTTARPLAEARIPDPKGHGFHRLAAHLDMTSRSPALTIRKFPHKKLSITELIRFNTLSPLEAAYLIWQLVNRGFILIVGGMASGKTTLLQALISALPISYKVVTIEDTPELSTPAQNWHPLYVRRAPKASELEDVDFSRLVIHSLRHRGTVVTLGEVRGKEMADLIQAAASVTGDTPVLIRIGEVTKLVRIGELVDKLYEEEGNPHEWAKVRPKQKIEVLTLTRDGRAEFKPIRWALRHRANEIYRIRYVGGEVKATGSHSIFVIDEDTLEIKVKRVDELRQGDILVTFVKANPLGFKRMFDTNIHYKRVPPESWEADQSIIRAFLDEYIADGLRSQRRRVKTYSTVNEQLAYEIAWLARIGGYSSAVWHIHRQGKNAGRTYWYVEIADPRNRGANNGMGRLVPLRSLQRLMRMLNPRVTSDSKPVTNYFYEKRRKFVRVETAKKILDYILRERRREPDAEAMKLIERIRWLIESEVELTIVKEVERLPYSDYVYDFSVPDTEAFFGGASPVLLHNSGHGAICLPPETPVLAMLDDGKPRIMSIKEAVERFNNGEDILVYSFNRKSGVFEWKKVTGAIKVPTQAWVIIETANGRKLKMTPDHRIPVYNPVTNSIEMLEAKDLRIGDKIVVMGKMGRGKERRTFICCDIYFKYTTNLAKLLAGYLTRGIEKRYYVYPKSYKYFFTYMPIKVPIRERRDGKIVIEGDRFKHLMDSLLDSIKNHPFSIPEKFLQTLHEEMEGVQVELPSESHAIALHYALKTVGIDSVVDGKYLTITRKVDDNYTLEEIINIKVEQTVMEDSYDIEVEDTHTFIAGDSIVSGNCTFHAHDPKTVLARITSPPINASPESLELINSIVYVSRTKTYARGKPETVRRVLRIYEIVGLKNKKPVSTVTFSWNPNKDVHNPPVTDEGLIQLWKASRTIRVMGTNLYVDEAPRALVELLVMSKYLSYLVKEKVFDIKDVAFRMTTLYLRLDNMVKKLWESKYKKLFRNLELEAQ